MAGRIAIIQGGPPDPAGRHLAHALAEAYAEGAMRAGHELRRVEGAKLEFQHHCGRRAAVLKTVPVGSPALNPAQSPARSSSSPAWIASTISAEST